MSGLKGVGEAVVAGAKSLAPVVSVLSSAVGIYGMMKGAQGMDLKMPSLSQSSSPQSTLEAPKAMPSQDSALVQDAKRRAVLAASQRGGRSSTFLSNSNDRDADTFGG